MIGVSINSHQLGWGIRQVVKRVNRIVRIFSMVLVDLRQILMQTTSTIPQSVP